MHTRLSFVTLQGQNQGAGPGEVFIWSWLGRRVKLAQIVEATPSPRRPSQFLETWTLLPVFPSLKWTHRIPLWSSGSDSVTPLQGAGVQSLVGELRSRILHGAAKGNKRILKKQLKQME